MRRALFAMAAVVALVAPATAAGGSGPVPAVGVGWPGVEAPLGATGSSAAPAAAPLGAADATRQVAVRFAPGTSPARIADLTAGLGLRPIGDPSALGVRRFLADTTSSRVAAQLALARDPAVVYAERVRTLRAATDLADPDLVGPTPNDPRLGEQWGLQAVGIRPGWAYVGLRTAAPIVIAIVDTGVDRSHPDLAMVTDAGIDLVRPGSTVGDGSDDGHGTHVAGIAGATTDNGIGIAGSGWGARILPVRVLREDGSGDDAVIAAGIEAAVDAGARIVNLSLGGPDPCGRTLSDAVVYAIGKGAIVVAASGNETAPVSCPANLPGVVAVGNVERDLTVRPTSNTGPALALVAPGTEILSTVPMSVDPSGYAIETGTSMSAPLVAGAAALVWAAAPSLDARGVVSLLERTATDLGAPGRDDRFGAGLIDVGAAIRAAAEVVGPARVSPAIAAATITPDPTPTPSPTATPVGPPVATPAPVVPGSTFSFDALVKLDAAKVTVERATDGGLVRTLAGGTLPAGPATFPWDGLDAAGTPVVDGSYAFRAELAAPGGRVATLVVPVGVSAALVAATVTPAAISPNGDGRMDRVVVRASLRSRAATTIRIEDTAGPDSVTLVSGDRPKGVTSATWDGRFGTKAAVGGRYIAVVTVRTATGTFSTRLPFTVDMKGAVATPLAASPVYPIADGYRDTTQLRFRLSEAASGTVTVLRSGSSKVLRSIPFKRAPRGSASVTWDGRDGSGRPATAGTYRFRVTTRDDAGNLRASGDGTVVVSSQRLVSTTVTVTLPGDALDASASRVEGGPGSSVGPVDTFEGGYRLAVTRATDGGEGFGDLVYRAAVPVGTVAVSLTVGVTYTAAGPDPVRIFGFGPAPDEDLVTYGTLALDGSTSSIAVPVSMLPSPSAGDVMLLLVIEGEGTVDVGSITLTYRYGILR